MKRKARLVGMLWRPALALILAICLLPLSSRPAAALSPGDYFSFSYHVQFSKSQVTGSELFYATMTAEATCTQDLPWPYSLASRVSISGRIIAEHQTSGVRVTLNSGYNVIVEPFPKEKDDSIQVSKVVSLQFPGGSQSGTYNVIGELDEVVVTAIGSIDVTKLFPASQEEGSVTYTAGTAGFVITELTIMPPEVNIGEEVSIGALVTNTGETAGSYKVTLKMDNQVVTIREVTLEGVTAEKVNFAVSESTAGKHVIAINGLSGTFTVREPTASPASSAPVERQWLRVGIIAAAAVLVVLVFLIIVILHRRRA